METACLRHTEIPHTSRLFSDFQYHFDRVARFYAHNPHDPRSYAAAAKADGVSGRSPGGTGSRACARATAIVLRSILLARPGTVAVVTGQQVGLFSGPAYTIYKALTAVRLAAQLNAQGIPAVPMFWLATEDHDFAEVNHTFVFGPDHRPIPLSVDGHGGSERPVGAIPIAAPPVDRCAKSWRAFRTARKLPRWSRRAYPAGVTFGAAFHALLERLLARRGLLFVDPLDESRAADGRALVAGSVRGRTKACTPSYSSETANSRRPVITRRCTWRRKHRWCFCWTASGASRCAGRMATTLPRIANYSAAELMDRAEHLSPNALLRPVVQDYVLPTVAYVGGPAELAYMAQSQVLYESAGPDAGDGVARRVHACWTRGQPS